MTAEVRDLQLRFSALEGRVAAMESRFSAMEIRLGPIERRLDVQEERMSATLAVIVRIAERLDRTTEPPIGLNPYGGTRHECLPLPPAIRF